MSAGLCDLVSAEGFGCTLGSGDLGSELGENVRRVGEASRRGGERKWKAVSVQGGGNRSVEGGLVTFGRGWSSRSGGSLGASMGRAAGSGASAGGARRRSRIDGANKRSGSRCAGRSC